ncbi:gliding motility lipoprotein GldH [Polaribacter sp. IC073]|uniref:gliding motility lipoprotein GldH n=1 Tax=Polaribacter sp. IC073 TaxID=2508540 RepID=UPI0011BDF0D5|nr:gliding motility lipoprotein GldH [Polaribacter sp. IC073]TXD49746.1 gliding motility lipoprotein GldH [Polaribacter sp. IC073]
MEAIQKNKFLAFVLVSILMIACNDISEFNQYKTLENSSWSSGEKITFNFEVKDTISPKNLFVNIRNNTKYEYSNLYVITELKFPNNGVVIDTLQYEMTDVSGKFLGDGFSGVKENKLFYKERKVFPFAGNYTLTIRQAMRKNGEINTIENLQGIKDVGFSIEKIN